MSRRVSVSAAAALGALFGSTLLSSDITAERYLGHVRYLASPEMKGRLTGSPELNRAADYIAGEFKNEGVQPVNGSYFQDFEVTAKTGLGAGDRTSFHIGSVSRDLKENADFVPLNRSSNGSASGGIVFAGYGITAPEYHYDDYASIDVSGKIVLILSHEPQEFDEKSVFAGKELTTHGELESKISNAKLHGAKAILLAGDTPNHPADGDGLPRFRPVTATGDFGILTEQITGAMADTLLGVAHTSVGEVIRGIDRDLKPRPVDLSESVTASVTVQLSEEKRTVHNVVGWIAGNQAEFVILGAHYDHLGLGEQENSLAPSLIGTVHPGADDNASGTAGVIELGRHFAALPKQKRGFLLLCFAGEEEGLLGSSYYADHALKPLRDAVAMINMDMIGRVRDNKVYIGGIASGSTFQPFIDEATKHSGFEADPTQSSIDGSSDHTSFLTKRVPSLFFFSGLHSDYHKPGDTPDKINGPGAVKLLDEVAEVAQDIADAPGRPEFIRAQPNAHQGSISSSGSSGYGPYFGSVPDFGGPANGVRFSDVREGSPAAKAGFQARDVMVEFDGKPIQNLYDFTYALRQHKPGDTVLVKVLREGKPVEASVTLTKRN